MNPRLVPLAALLLTACQGGSEASVLDPPGSAIVSSARSPWAIVRAPGDLPLLKAPASALASPQARAALTPPFPARVVHVHVRPGDRVEAGAPLVEVVMPRVVEAAGRLAAAQVRLEAQSARHEKLVALREVGMVRAADLAEVEAAIGEARAELLAERAILASAGLQDLPSRSIAGEGRVALRSPVAGIVTEVDAPLGAMREPGEGPLVRIAGDAAERVAARLPMALPQEAKTVFAPAAGAPVAVELLSIAPLVDPRDGSREAFFALPAQSGVLAGSSGVVQALLPEELGAVAVPARALELRGGEAIVYRRRGEAVEEVRVEVLATGGDDALVKGALRPGEEVAADAAAHAAGGEP